MASEENLYANTAKVAFTQKTKKNGFSPKKAEKLSYQVPVYDVNKKNLGSLVYDPRRPQFRNMPSYNDSVRSRVINYRRYKKRRTFGIHGVYAAAYVGSLVHDHDYLRPRLDHQWILNLIQVNKYRCFDQNLKLSCVRSNVINVFFVFVLYVQAFSDDCDGIEKRTRNQSSCKEWYYVKSFIITASHVGEIVHMTERRDKAAYADGLVSPIPLRTPAIVWGRQHEKTAKAVYENKLPTAR